MLQSGIIRYSTSNWASPLFCVPKKTGDVRIVFDYRKLNALTKEMKCQLPNIEDLMTLFKGKGFITSLDMKGGYWHIPIRPSDRHKTAFIFDSTLYEWNVLPFGSTNAPALFQKTMNQIFKPLIQNGTVVVYLDDIAIISETLEDHRRQLKDVFELISKYNNHLRIDKCTFGTTETEYLGFIIDKIGIRATKRYKQKVLNVKKPENRKQMMRFIGLVNYLHRFLPNMHQQTRILTNLLKKDQRWRWGPEEEQAFVALNAKVQSTDYLVHPDITKPFHLYTDASIDGIKGMLAQYDEAGMLNPVSFCSKTFNQTQQNWHCSEQEIYAVIYMCEKWRYLLLQKKFHVHTDHKNLQQLFNKAKDFRAGKLCRWAVRLQDFHFECEYVPGKDNVFADYLSRDGLEIANMKIEHLAPLAIQHE